MQESIHTKHRTLYLTNLSNIRKEINHDFQIVIEDNRKNRYATNHKYQNFPK